MLHHAFAHPWMLCFLVILPVLAVLRVWSGRQQRWALEQLVGPLIGKAQGGTSRSSAGAMPVPPARWPVPRSRRWRSSLGFLLGLLGVGIGMAGPQWGRDWDQSAAPGRDIVVVLDCSRSMLAETPSRLQRARAALVDLADTVEKRGGHRLALVWFAGKAQLACPLTHDYDHFRSKLDDLEAVAQGRDLEPEPDAKSGTRLGQALALAATCDDPRFIDRRDLLLLSDGDDPARDAEWRNGVRAAAALGIRVYTVGIGDPNTASVIPLDSGPLRHDGQLVGTRLEEAPLREIAEQTGGLYFSARTQTVPLGRLFLDRIERLPKREDNDDALPVYQQRAVWFLAPALGLLILSMFLGDGLGKTST